MFLEFEFDQPDFLNICSSFRQPSTIYVTTPQTSTLSRASTRTSTAVSSNPRDIRFFHRGFKTGKGYFICDRLLFLDIEAVLKCSGDCLAAHFDIRTIRNIASGVNENYISFFRASSAQMSQSSSRYYTKGLPNLPKPCLSEFLYWQQFNPSVRPDMKGYLCFRRRFSVDNSNLSNSKALSKISNICNNFNENSRKNS